VVKTRQQAHFFGPGLKKFGEFHGCSRFSLWKTGDFAGKSMELARIEFNNTRRRAGFSG